MALLIDESAAGGVSSDRLARPVRDFAFVRCPLAEAAVGLARVVVLDVLAGAGRPIMRRVSPK